MLLAYVHDLSVINTLTYMFWAIITQPAVLTITYCLFFALQFKHNGLSKFLLRHPGPFTRKVTAMKLTGRELGLLFWALQKCIPSELIWFETRLTNVRTLVVFLNVLELIKTDNIWP